MSPEPEKVQVEVEGRSLVLTNLTKVLYPETGFTKGAVIDYYLRAAPVLLPHIADRPLTLRRYPDGVTGQHFYNKHAPDHRPDWIRTERLPAPGSTSGRDWVRYVIAGDLPTLIWTANLAGLELHTPMWRIPDVAQPDLLVFDLDPGAPATIVECCAVALWLRPLLAEAGFGAFAKTSGGKGLQRARARPTVSTPVTWDEVAECERPEDLVFTSGDVLDRVARHGDLLAPLVAEA